MDNCRRFVCALILCVVGVIQPVVAAVPHYQIIAPKCLINLAKLSAVAEAEDGDLVLLDVDESEINRLAQAKHAGIHAAPVCGGFHDVTDALQKSGLTPQTFLSKRHFMPPTFKSDAGRTVAYPEAVQQLLSEMNPQNMWTELTTLTNFKDRYANSESGVEAAKWIHTRLSAMAIGHDDVTVYSVPTRGYKQPSVILKVGKSTEPGIVISGHMDTLSGWWGMYHMPGADDDGSGSVTVLEAARTVLASHMQFKRPIYFIWYAAEEEGLVGSGSVVTAFSEKNIPVKSVLHYDMTGYEYHNDPTMWLLQDYTQPELTDWLAILIDTYVRQKVDYTRCGYDCSDHASWTHAGISAGAATETRFANMNPSLHTTEDKMDKLSLRHMTDYLKLALAFIVEEAEPIS